VPADEIEELADLKQQWHMVKKKAFEVNGNLQSLQGGFRGKLLEGVVEFIDQVLLNLCGSIRLAFHELFDKKI
jgi:hypothetical protein